MNHTAKTREHERRVRQQERRAKHRKGRARGRYLLDPSYSGRIHATWFSTTKKRRHTPMDKKIEPTFVGSGMSRKIT
jgi:hypothetical protein